MFKLSQVFSSDDRTTQTTAELAAGARSRQWPRDFKDRLTSPLPRLRDVWRALTAGGLRTSRADADRIPVQLDGLPSPAVAELAVTWAGHASFVIQYNGMVVLTDPVWSDRIPGGLRRLTPVGVPWSQLPRVDAVLISHNHYDHLDVPTIKRLPRDTPFLVPAGLGRWFWRRGFIDVTELDWYESTTVGTLSFDFVPAHHWSRRSPFDTCASLWGGWIVHNRYGDGAALSVPDSDRKALYFAGDTGYGRYFSEIGERYPGLDIALLPIGAYSPRWFHRPWHLDPEEAVRACIEVGASRMGSMHWGTFTLSGEPLLEPLARVRSAWEAADRPPADLWDFAVGESHVL